MIRRNVKFELTVKVNSLFFSRTQSPSRRELNEPEGVLGGSLPLAGTLGSILLLGTVFALPALAEPSLDRARQLERNGQLRSAERVYTRLLERTPNHEKAALGLLRTSVLREKWNRATRVLKRLERISPRSTQAARWGTRLYFVRQQYDTAARWARRYRSRQPGHWEPYHFQAQVALRQGDLLGARKHVDSAFLRSDSNPWVLFDDLMVRRRLRGDSAPDRVREIRKRASDPLLHWKLARMYSSVWTKTRVRKLLQEGVPHLSQGSRPPLQKPVSAQEYRYWLARFQYETGGIEAARNTLNPARGSQRVRWLLSMLPETPRERLRKAARVLRQHPDHTVRQWVYAGLARQVEPLGGSHRERASDYFYRQYEHNRMLARLEAALSALTRSLEMDPTRAPRQFELARFYHDRGWLLSERNALSRVVELDLIPRQRVEDYREGLRRPPGPTSSSYPAGRVLVGIRMASMWEGPLNGPTVLGAMLEQAFHHQPALSPVRVETGIDANSFEREMKKSGAEAGVHLRIDRWDNELDARIALHLPGRPPVRRDHSSRGATREWNLQDILLEGLKKSWSWEGTVYETSLGGAWVNLGTIHGINRGDSLAVGGIPWRWIASTNSASDSGFPPRCTVPRRPGGAGPALFARVFRRGCNGKPG